ncbi:MAG TPA: CHAT domain-containing protein, partial [Pirellulales bacterium]|nr:CHAT domain-containing protein [Pirellulales bacterium]
EAARLFDGLTRKSQDLANLSLGSVEPGHEEEHRRRLALLSDEVEQAERSLAAASREFRRDLDGQTRTPADLQKALPANAVLVDFVEYKHFTPPTEKVKLRRWEPHLAAFLVRREKPLEQVELGPVAPIERAIQSWRRKFVPLATDELPDLSVPRTADDDQDPGRRLRELIWDKLQSRLTGAPVVLISPDRATARFPWPAMPGKEPGTYLVEETAVAVVPIPRLLAELGHDKPAGAGASAAKDSAPEQSLLLVGDVNYDANPGRASAGTIAQSAPRGTRAGQLLHWPPLDGTRTEMATIADSFEQQFPDGRLDKLRGDRATKAALIGKISDHRYVHLATHGFFAPKELKSALGVAMGAENRGAGGATSLRDVAGYPPGLLSGVVLAGANRPAAEGNDDGILTALEVSQLDLRRVDLATLSACETGLGESAGGEGVLGLQRALQIAGAKSVVATLWRISDDASRALMSDFYDNLWNRKMTKLEALRQAQLKMLRTGANRGLAGVSRGLKFANDQPPDSNHRLPPYYWAPFVLSGDWQ